MEINGHLMGMSETRKLVARVLLGPLYPLVHSHVLPSKRNVLGCIVKTPHVQTNQSYLFPAEFE